MRSDLKNRNTVSSTARASHAESLENAPDLASPCCASNENSCFKENININKSETPKLSLEPLQMKRKKKGGGCNLRKSLAWDRAFFTEEGFLDPLELSVISGVSCREGLPSISEDTPGGSQKDEDLGKDRKQDRSSQKLDLSSSNLVTSNSLTSNKVPTHVGSKPGSRCGDCPRPLPSPSLKRPANVNVGKAAGKELKLPKVPGLKPGLSPTCATTKSKILKANRVKHNQITQPDFSIQRHAELEISSKSLKNTQNASRANTRQSAHHSDGNSGISSFRRHSSVNMSPVMVDKASNSGSKMISDNATPIRPEKTSESQLYDSTTSAASFSKNTHICDRTLHPSQNQMTKPSGLRMPSPSLSFFSQPKPSVFRDLPPRDRESNVFGSHNPGNSSLEDNLSRSPKTYIRIPRSTISSSKAISSRSECIASSHVSAIKLVKPKLEQNPMHKIQDLPKENIIARISHQEAELLKIGTEVPPQSGSREQAMDNFKKAIDVSQLKNESGGSRRINAELGPKQTYASQESPKEKDACNFLVLNHGTKQCTVTVDDRVQNTLKMQSDCEKTSMPDCHELHKEKTDPLKYSLGEIDKRTDKDKKVLKEKERAIEQLGVSQQIGSCCNGSIKALEQRQAKADNLPADQAHMQNLVFASTIGDCKGDINLFPEVADDIRQPGKGSEVQINCLKVEMESEQIVKLDTRDRWSPEKQIYLQNSQREEKVEKLLFVIPDKRDGNEMIDTEMPISPGIRDDSNLGKEKNLAQPLMREEFDSVDNSLSNCLYLDSQGIEINNCSPLPQSRTHQLSQVDTLGKMTEERPCMQDGSAYERLTSTLSLKDCESDIDNIRSLQDRGTVLVRSPESNMLNACCFKQSEDITLSSDEFVAENLLHNNDHLLTKIPHDVYCEDNALESTEDSVTGQSEICLGISKSSSLSAKESPLKHESCNDAYGTQDNIAAITDPSRVEPFSDTIKGEVSEDSLGCLHPKLDHVKVETALAPNNKHGDGLKKDKNFMLVLPQNATPFSDEWLAAIEAAGEDILTRKGGAVQNSPPDKSLPEPSPWSPVKKEKQSDWAI